MIRSMTGYGRGESFIYNRKFVVEIKSVNHRYNDLTIKLPRILNILEDNARKVLSKEIFRGKTDVYISMDTNSKDDIRLNINYALADKYVDELDKLGHRYILQDGITLDMLTKLPDLFSVEKGSTSEKAMYESWVGLNTALLEALNTFVAMRQREGTALKTDLLTKLESINANLSKIELRAPNVVSDYTVRLKQRLSELIDTASIDENRLLTEIVMFADKSCIDEEITRFKSHVSQMSSILDEVEPVGRKLDFLVQEMNREINTMGSKSNDIELTKLVIDTKSDIEKIREQVQNIE